MTRVLEYLEDVQVEDQRVYRCFKCGNVLGPVSQDYKSLALSYDAPISEGEPAHLAPENSNFVLRQYFCPNCAVLFEVDMVPKEESRFRSIELA
ncbi:MAG: acetone carboxylase subunit gamma [Dehalococcoidia bacterium]|nr:acetone carboxylase subunit gamma [Dehalococcoidia bacterium]